MWFNCVCHWNVCRYWRDKLDTLIEFPIKYANIDTIIVSLFRIHSAVPMLFPRGLDLGQYVKSQDQPESVYDLFAVSNHFGGMGGGHCEIH